MTKMTRLVEQLVADIDIDDDGLVRVHVTQPLTPDEARDAAAAMLVAAKAGEDYAAEQHRPVDDGAAWPRCLLCRKRVERDEHSSNGWRHVLMANHTAVLDEAIV